MIPKSGKPSATSLTGIDFAEAEARALYAALPSGAMNPITGKLFAAARIKHPTAPGLYYRAGDTITPWVETGWSHWSMGGWIETFLKQYSSGQDNRNWEFFGEPIDLWPPGDVGYSGE